MYDNNILSKNNTNSRHGSSSNNIQHSNTPISHHPGYRASSIFQSSRPLSRSSSTNATSSHQQGQNHTSWVPNNSHNQHHHPHNNNHHYHQHQQQQQHSNYQFRHSNSNASNAPTTTVTPATRPTTTNNNNPSTGNGSRSGSQGKGSNHHQQNHQHSPTSFVLHKLSSFSKRKSETDKRKVAERELDSLNSKIDKLLSKMGEPEVESHTKLNLEEECVVCLAAPACMQTFPCGHKVVCRKCLIKTIQVAVSQRCLPLRCVICRNRILRLQHATASASAITTTPSSSSYTQLQYQQKQLQQHQVGLQDSSAMGGHTPQPSSSPSPSSSLSSSSSPLSYNSPGSPIAPGCAAAGALTLTPIVIRSLTSSNQESYCLPNGTILSGSVEGYCGGYPYSIPSRSPSPSPLLCTTSGPPSSRPARDFADQHDISRELSCVHEVAIADDSWKRTSPPPLTPSTPTDMEAFVFSHNDALNIHVTKPPPLPNSAPHSNQLDPDHSQCDNNGLHTSSIRRSNSSSSSSTRKFRSSFLGKRDTNMKNTSGTSNASSGSGKHGGKSSGKTLFSTKPSGMMSTSPGVPFMPGQTIKVHPETMAQPNGFMTSSQSTSPDAGSAASHPSSSPTRFSKSNISASTFIAKFLPKSSRRRYNCLRHE